MRVILILFNWKWLEKIEESHSDEIKYVAWSQYIRRIKLLGLVIEAKVSDDDKIWCGHQRVEGERKIPSRQRMGRDYQYRR